MKRLLWIALCTCMTLAALAQKQQGIVRTIERPGQKSVGINGVTIKINEYPNAIVSGKGGKFSFTIQGKRQGDRCLVTRVEKKGYTLIDKMPSFAYSISTPVEIVMVSNKQLQQDEKRIRDKATEKAEANYNKRITELERQLQEKTISEEKYREQLQHVFDGYENYIKMIDDMARRYAMTDYKGISDINRQIQECIENAELERADSLINSKGDIQQRKQELDEKRGVKQKIDSLSLALQEEIDFGINELASDYFTKHLICAARYDNDSAAYWLEQRAALDDSTNVEWLREAGDYYDVYLAEYNSAKLFFMKALEQSSLESGDSTLQTANCYNSLGAILGKLGDYETAIKYLQKSYSIFEASNNTDGLVATLNIIGTIECLRGDYKKSEETFTRSINYIDSVTTEKELFITACNGKGMSLAYQNDFKDAIDWMYKSLDIGIRYYGELHPSVAMAYNNIGGMYMETYDLLTAQRLFEKALNIEETILSDNHPAIAYSFYNLACIYNENEDYDSALSLFNKALSIRKKVHGQLHSDVAECYNAIAFTYSLIEDFPQALNYYERALSIWKSLNGKESDVARVLNNIGNVYSNLDVHSTALDYYLQSLEMKLNFNGNDDAAIATSYNNIAGEYDSMGKYQEALDYYHQALNLRIKLFGEYDILVSVYYSNIGYTFEEMNCYDQALEYYEKALMIRERLLGNEDSSTLKVREKVDSIKQQMQNQ